MFLSLGIGLVGCASLAPEKAPVSVSPLQYSATETQGIDNVLIITDASNSLYLNRTFPDAKAFSEGFVAVMPEPVSTYKAGGIGFGGPDRTIAPLAPFDRSALAEETGKLKPMGGMPGGMTPLHQVFDEVNEELRNAKGKTAIILVSDLVPDSPKKAEEAAKRLVASHPGEICLYVVRVGDNEKGQAFAETLRKVSPCGSVNQVANLETREGMTDFARTVFATAKPTPPPVAAPPPVEAGPPCEATVRLHGVGFGFDRSDLTSDRIMVLDEVAQHLRDCPALKIEIGGHTDSTGTEEYNQKLGERRAEAVKSQLIQAGIDPSRMVTKSYGEDSPVAPNNTADGRAENRRADLVPIK